MFLLQGALVASGQSSGLFLRQMTLAPIVESAKRREITSFAQLDLRYINRCLIDRDTDPISCKDVFNSLNS